MKYPMLLIVLLAVGILGCEGTIELGENTVMPALPSSEGKSDAPGVAAAPALNGAALYQQHCASCHGADATGGASFPGSIVNYSPIQPIITNGIGVMAPVPISADETAAIQGFLLGNTPPPPTQPVTQPDPSTGSTPALQVYASECAPCHGAEGLGTAQGPAIRTRDAGLARFTVREGRNGPGNPTTMPIYDRATMPDAQLDEIIDWLDAFPNPPSGEGLYNQYCGTCHGEDGGGGTTLRPIAGQLRAMTDIRDGHHTDEFDNRREYMPAWTADQISDAEIVLIEQWMRDL